MIETISIKNFKSHADTTIELGRVTALVGPNGCGKTGLLQAIDCISGLSSQPPAQVFTGNTHPDVLVRNHGKSFSMDVALANEEARGNLSIKIEASGSYTGHSREWGMGCLGEWQHLSLGRISVAWGSPIFDQLPKSLIEALGPAVYFKPSPKHLAQPSPIEVTPPKLLSDGSGLPTVIANLLLSDSERHQAIEDDLRKIVPNVCRIKARQSVVRELEHIYSVTERGMPTTQVRHNSKPGYELIFDMKSGSSLPASAISEGTLLILGLLTLLHSPYPPVVFLFDDIEHGLHPLAQQKLVQLLIKFAEKHQKQIIFTTHSPYIIDELNAKDVWVMATDSDGISHCQQLSKGPNAEFGLKVLTTGEFLDAEGEEWVLNPPVQEEPAHV